MLSIVGYICSVSFNRALDWFWETWKWSDGLFETMNTLFPGLKCLVLAHDGTQGVSRVYAVLFKIFKTWLAGFPDHVGRYLNFERQSSANLLGCQLWMCLQCVCVWHTTIKGVVIDVFASACAMPSVWLCVCVHMFHIKDMLSVRRGRRRERLRRTMGW